MTRALQLGYLGDTAGTVAQGLATAAPFTGPAAPFVLAAAGLVSLGDSIAHLFNKYDPTKLHDTAIVEAFESAAHGIWFILTGEVLPGIPGVSAATTPGNYGAAGINLFQDSAYPNVPFPAGAPGIDANAALQSLTATYQNFAGQLERPESAPNLANNYRILSGWFEQVAAAQSASGSAPSGTLGGLVSQLPWWGWLAGGVAAVKLLFAGIAHEYKTKFHPQEGGGLLDGLTISNCFPLECRENGAPETGTGTRLGYSDQAQDAYRSETGLTHRSECRHDVGRGPVTAPYNFILVDLQPEQIFGTSNELFIPIKWVMA